jgi:hypothetical protein
MMLKMVPESESPSAAGTDSTGFCMPPEIDDVIV